MLVEEEKSEQRKSTEIKKALTGIKGLDEITQGGLPANRATLVCGGPGSGKTLMSMEFIVNGITQANDNGVFISFDEARKDLSENVASLGFDIDDLIEKKRLAVIAVPQHQTISAEIGEYDLGGLMAMIAKALDSVQAGRIVIDGIETLFSLFKREQIIRHELKKLVVWLKERQVTAIITCERGEGQILISRHGVEEYISDCVILLDQRVVHQIAVRRLKILKYRGTLHGTNEYPFLVTSNGISIFPVTSMFLDFDVTEERVSTGIPELDTMLSGEGYYKGSSILITGTAGTGKSSLAASFAASVCSRKGRCIYFAFEESPKQIVRNMKSIGLDLSEFENKGLLLFHNTRPTEYGVEMHLLNIHSMVKAYKPDAVIFDPISNLTDVAIVADIKSMFVRILDYLKNKHITSLSTDLTSGGEHMLNTEIGISSLMDTWIVLQNNHRGGRRHRSLDIVKSRGMAHEDKLQEFDITNKGVVFS